MRHLDGCGFNEAVGRLAGERRDTRTARPPDRARAAEEKAYAAERRRRQHEKARWLWSHRRPIEGTIAERYLREARAITCPLPSTLAFLPALKPNTIRR